MTIENLRLDDLNWTDMVEAIRSRIAVVSDEDWSLHSPVDPGVTLLELFAYLLEQRVYWLDQIPDTLLNALIKLHGAAPRPARAAHTLMELIDSGSPRDVAVDNVFVRREQRRSFRFTTLEGAAVLPVARIDIESVFGTASALAGPMPDERGARWHLPALALLPATRQLAEFQIVLWLKQPLPAQPPAEPLSVLLELDVPDHIPPGWSPDQVNDVSPPAKLRWSYSAAGGEKPFVDPDVEDGTQGLRRSGTVRFTVPADWTALHAPVNGLTPYLIWCRTDESTFSSPPKLKRIVPNVATAAHHVAVDFDADEIEKQLEGWLPLPEMRLTLPGEALPLEDSVKVRIRERDDNHYDWSRAIDFSHYGPTDRVFTVDRERLSLTFGNGLTGRVPVPHPSNTPRMTVEYLAGGGEVGNLGAHLYWEDDKTSSLVARNTVAARGGREAESSSDARARTAARMQDRERAITKADFEELSKNTPGVAIKRAFAAVGHHPCFPCITVPGAVTVFIVPDVPRREGWLGADVGVTAPLPDPGMISEVLHRLDERRMVTTEVFVRAPTYRQVDLAAHLAGDPLDKPTLESELREGLTHYLDPLIGGDDADGWPFGQPLRPSELTHVMQQLLGDEAVVERVGIRLDAEKKYESCEDVAIEPFDLVTLRSLAVHWRRATPHAGGLR